MAASSRILLLDDGELDDVAAILENLGLEHTRLRGGEILSEVPPPLDLVVATPRRSSSVLAATPGGARQGRPVRVIVTEEDSNSMRQMLRRAGYQLLVRRPTHPEIWRLLIQRAIYQGDERRDDKRLPVGSDVQIDGSREACPVLLLDISARGCRIAFSQPLAQGSVVTVSIPSYSSDSEFLELSGEVLRSDPSPDEAGSFNSALSFLSLAEGTRKRLSTLLDALANRPDSLATTGNAITELPPESDEDARSDGADAAVAAHLEVKIKPERRRQPRGAYTQSVLAESGGDHNGILMGRDLSAGGMRVERLPNLEEGDRFTLAIYGPARAEPMRIQAIVCRDDGEEGLALRFENVTDETSRELEKLVAALPDVESLDRSESESMGTVLSEIVA